MRFLRFVPNIQLGWENISYKTCLGFVFLKFLNIKRATQNLFFFLKFIRKYFNYECSISVKKVIWVSKTDDAVLNRLILPILLKKK